MASGSRPASSLERLDRPVLVIGQWAASVMIVAVGVLFAAALGHGWRWGLFAWGLAIGSVAIGLRVAQLPLFRHFLPSPQAGRGLEYVSAHHRVLNKTLIPNMVAMGLFSGIVSASRGLWGVDLAFSGVVILSLVLAPVVALLLARRRLSASG